jgi:endonuclease-3
MASAALARRLDDVARRLSGRYGVPGRRRADPLDVLIETVLSQHTSDVNSGRAFRALKAAWPSWPLAARAPRAALERAIRPGGLAKLKSHRILRILAALRRREGRYDLGVLRRLSPPDALRRLDGLPGVGPKTRACVLLFGCGHPEFPVDTHVHRIVRRLGLAPGRASAEQAHARLAPAVPPRGAMGLHLNLIRLGRELCRPRDPLCAECPLRRLCAYARRAA